MQNILTRKISLPFNLLGNNIKDLLTQKIVEDFEGICVKEGFVKKKSCNVISYSAGVVKGNHVRFDVLFECLICKPSEGMKFRVIVKNITKAGIRAEYKDNDSPVVVFIARDHVYKNKLFSSLSIDDNIFIKVIGVRFELNDEFISIIADLDGRKKIGKKNNLNTRS